MCVWLRDTGPHHPLLSVLPIYCLMSLSSADKWELWGGLNHNPSCCSHLLKQKKKMCELSLRYCFVALTVCKPLVMVSRRPNSKVFGQDLVLSASPNGVAYLDMHQPSETFTHEVLCNAPPMQCNAQLLSRHATQSK